MNNTNVSVGLKFLMRYCMLLMILGLPEITNSFWPAPYRVDLHDRKTFVITAGEDEKEDNEESEIEMIAPKDLHEIVDLARDEERYKPLHSHVEHYNRRAAEAAKKYSVYIPESQLNFEETNLSENEKPFIAGFKHELDKYKFERVRKSANDTLLEIKESGASSPNVNRIYKNGEKSSLKNSKSVVKGTGDRSKREDDEDDILGLHRNSENDLVESMSPRNKTLEQDRTENAQATEISSTTTERIEEYEDDKTAGLEESGSSEGSEKGGTPEKPANGFLESKLTTPPVESNEKEEDIYDYESLRAEYDQQIADAIKSNLTYNYTDSGEPEETPKDAIKKIVDFDMPKNCTDEELSKFGAKAFACLVHDYRNAKNRTDTRKIVTRTWKVMKIWLCIYVCIAVPAWCQKGWCCCCFRCGFCFPYKRIAAAKKYYADNEPGILAEQPSKTGGGPKPIKYKPTLFEIDAYEELESTIRNL